MKKPAPTLADVIYRLTFAKNPGVAFGSQPGQLGQLRDLMIRARRFRLDEEMATFLGDLSTAAFTTSKIAGNARVRSRRIEQMRVSARVPHAVTWIEYPARATLARIWELLGFKDRDPRESPAVEGWLIEQHPHQDTAFRMHLFTHSPGEIDPVGFDTWAFPFAYAWTTDDSPSPWPSMFDGGGHPVMYQSSGRRIGVADSVVMAGIDAYESPSAVIIAADLYPFLYEEEDAKLLWNLLKEWAGVIRRVWALLASINDIPIKTSLVKQAKGFVARGSYRRFLDHTTITLNLPARADKQKVARNLIALIRRRAHMVRGHWRKDYRHPGHDGCNHEWTADQTCALCGGHRLWIHEHERGDASIGYVTHDYAVKHPKEGAEQ